MTTISRTHSISDFGSAQRELDKIRIAIQKLKLHSDSLDLEDVAVGVARAIKDGQLEVLNRVLEGKVPGVRITLTDFLKIQETTTPTLPEVDYCKIYAKDSSGKTEILASFPTGAAQRIAIQA